MMEAVAPPPTTFRLTPRPYQYEAVAALLAATARGVQRPLLVLPTGTGKTIVFALLVQRRGGRSLILAHRDELIQQAVDKLHLVDPTLPLGVVQATRDEHTAPTVVASVQTLSRRTRLTRLVPDFQTIVIDEAHHAPAPTYRRILDYCRAWQADGPLVVGVTATPERGDHHSLRQVFDRIVYQKTLLEMMQAGYLVDLRALQVLLQADFDALRTQQGDFVDAELETLLLAANAPAQVLAAFQTHAADRKALLFTPTVALAYAMAETFRTAGIPPRHWMGPRRSPPAGPSSSACTPERPASWPTVRCSPKALTSPRSTASSSRAPPRVPRCISRCWAGARGRIPAKPTVSCSMSSG